MRGMPNGSVNDRYLAANVSDAETNSVVLAPTATGFVLETVNNLVNQSGTTYIYMAIRRPMKVPTLGTSVFNVASQVASSGNTGGWVTSFTTDTAIKVEQGGISNHDISSRLLGNGRTLYTDATNAEAASSLPKWDYQFGWGLSSSTNVNDKRLLFKRGSGFFDVVCYTGTGSNTTQAHNLGAVPELMIIKSRSQSTENWIVYAAPAWTGSSGFDLLWLNSDAGKGVNNNHLNETQPTSTVFSLGTRTPVNDSGSTYVAYLFATLAGVSKVGSYTGNGSSQTINCGFTAGARFVMVKATSTTGDWVVLDTARGIVSGNDPFLELNTTAAEQTGQDILDPDSSGFVVNQTTESINASGVSYIFLAIA
jgi:hypothetical protein